MSAANPIVYTLDRLRLVHRLLNHVMKQGSATANTFGTLAVMYSGFGVILQWARGEDDDVNTVLAGTATGMLYKSTGMCWPRVLNADKHG